MSAQLSSTIVKELEAGVAQFAGLGYNMFAKTYDKVFKVEKSAKNFEERTLLSTLGVAQRVSELDGVTFDTFNQRYTVRFTHTKYGLGMYISREALDDAQQGVVDRHKVEELGRSCAKKKEIDHAAFINDAFTVSTAGDGAYLCSTTHVTAVSSSQSNRLATDADLSEASIEQMKIEMADITDERGNKIHVMPSKLLIPTELEFEAYRILNSVNRPGTADNDVNAVKAMGLIKELVIWPYLTDADAWFMLTDVKDGLISFDRKPVMVEMENDFDHDALKVKVLTRYSKGVVDWRSIYGTTGAA